jgi:hypothetical protein
MTNKMIAGDKMTVLVEGNTCSGKSSFLDLFNREKDAFCVINEPFERNAQSVMNHLRNA